jgi:hypothetical protein
MDLWLTDVHKNARQEKASSFKDESEGFEKSLFSKVIRLETGKY